MLTWFLEKGEEEGPAVVRPSGEVMTYGDLAAASRALADALLSTGVDLEGRPVALVLSDPAALLASIFGCWAAGAIPAPLDPRHGAAVRGLLLERLRPALHLVEAEEDRVAVEAGAEAPRQLAPPAALVAFTSGSTGEPRGVVLGGGGLQANVSAILGYLPLDRAARTPVVTPAAWIYTLVGQMLATLRAGGTLLAVGAGAEPMAQLAALRGLRATNLSSVPAALGRLAEAALAMDEAARPRLAWVGSAGGPLDAATAARLGEAFPAARLYNQYGLTEASPRVAAISSDEAPFARGAVGRPLPGVTVRAVGPDGAERAPGEAGELVVESPGLMLGYLDDEAATRRALAGGVLHTGDLGWVDGAGYVWVRGRLDGTVPIEGVRVSPDQVERRLQAALPDVALAVVAAGDRLTGIRLVAFLVDPDGSRTPRARQAIAALPPLERPAKLVALEALPGAAAGKVDRVALRRMVETE